MSADLNVLSFVALKETSCIQLLKSDDAISELSLGSHVLSESTFDL